MGATEKRMEQLGIRLQQTDWRGKGTVDAVLAGDMLYLSAHYPVNEQGEPVYQGRVGAEVTQEEAYQEDGIRIRAYIPAQLYESVRPLSDRQK